MPMSTVVPTGIANMILKFCTLIVKPQSAYRRAGFFRMYLIFTNEANREN